MAKKTVLVSAEQAARGALTLDVKINEFVKKFDGGIVQDYKLDDSNIDAYGFGSALVTVTYEPKEDKKKK